MKKKKEKGLSDDNGIIEKMNTGKKKNNKRKNEW